MIDKDFELRGEAAERPQPKKLTASDIPEGFRYAAVDKDGIAYAYWECPFIEDCTNDWFCHGYHYKQIGSFDASDWQNSLVSRETAERPEPKKLTAADIPEGCLCAAVDSTGRAFGYDAWVYPGHYDWHARIGADYNEVLIGENFDNYDWQNSLVSRETAERPQADAIKDQQDKPSFLEIDPNFLEAMAWRMTANKGKYPVNNWKGLTDRFAILDAIYRHANDIKRMLEGGESLTGETIQKHCAAIACNAQFLFYHSPENQWERAARSRQSNAKEI